MKKTKMFIAMLLVLVSALSITLPAMAAYSTMYVNVPVGETVNMRNAANSTATVLVRIPRGTAVQAEYYNATWHKVSYSGYTGYIMSQYLSTSNPNGSGGTEWISRYGNGTIESQSKTGGATVPQIQNLQEDLNYHGKQFEPGYTVLVVDGLYGTNSIKRVKEFQKNDGLSVDGYAGPNTKAKLYSCTN